jgi:cytochrome P450/NADPH-cytochrome P450 reductase
VQDRLWRERAVVVEVALPGAIVLVCGDGREIAPAVHDACLRIYQEAIGEPRESASSG